MPNLKHLALIASVSSLRVFAGSLIAPIEARYIQSRKWEMGSGNGVSHRLL